MSERAWIRHDESHRSSTASPDHVPVPGRRTLTTSMPAGVTAPGRATLVGDTVDEQSLQMLMGATIRPGQRPHSPLPTGGGASLPESVRRRMERSFGADLSDVRIHEGVHAAEIGALAFTTGNDIHFQPGRCDPSSTAGQELLGHELTHVLQQRRGGSTTQAKGGHVDGDRGLEAQADELGARAARGERIDPSQVMPASGGGLQCVIDPGKPKGTRVTIDIKPGVTAEGVIDSELSDERVYMVEITAAPLKSMIKKKLKFEYGKLTEILEPVHELPVERYKPTIEDKTGARLEFLRQTRERARQSFQVVHSPHQSLEIMRRITDDVDQLLRDVHEHALQQLAKDFRSFGDVRYAFIALGSYGRREMSTHSDIDLGLIFESSKDKDEVLGKLRFLLMAMEERIKALDESYVPKDGDEDRTTMGLRFDTAGMTPFGANSGSVTNRPFELAQNMIPNNPDAPRQSEDKLPVSAPTNALLDARYIPMPDGDPELYRKFTLAQEQLLDQPYQGPEQERLGPTNRHATAIGLFQKAQPVLLLCKEDVESQRSAINVKTHLRQALDWTTSGLAHLAHVPKHVTGTYERLTYMISKQLLVRSSLGRAMLDAVAWVATRRIQSHLHHNDERDVYRTGFHPEQVGTRDEKQKEGHESRNGLQTDLALTQQDIAFLRYVVNTVVDPLLAVIATPMQLIRNPFGDPIEERGPEDIEYREYLRERQDEI